MNVNDCFSHELGGDTLNEYIYSNVKKKIKDDYFPSLNSEDLIGEVDDNEGEEEEPINWANEYFITVALEDGTITFTPTGSNAISYSIDGGNTWTEGNSVNVVKGDSVIWKGTMTPSSNGIGSFSATTCNFDVKGNIMSLIYGDDFKNQLSIGNKTFWFAKLFNGAAKIVSAENLILPATTLAQGCYNVMFNGCTSLTTAPQLPATTLEEGCYAGMFNGCTSLTSAPQLPATTLEYNCYAGMFNGCTSLNYIKAMFTTTPSTTYTQSWVSGVASSGTFVKNSAATWDVSGVNGIPSGWTVETASE